MKNIEDYLHLYLGCECEWNKKKWNLFMYDVWNELAHIDCTDDTGLVEEVPANDVKPILRNLSDMTEEEKVELWDSQVASTKLSWGKDEKIAATNRWIYGTELSYSPELFLWLLSKHFDLFDLIEDNLAINK